MKESFEGATGNWVDAAWVILCKAGWKDCSFGENYILRSPHCGATEICMRPSERDPRSWIVIVWYKPAVTRDQS